MRADLSRFQEQLLAALADGAPTEEVVATAVAAAPDDGIAQWVEAWDPELVSLAGVLVRTWAYRSQDG